MKDKKRLFKYILSYFLIVFSSIGFTREGCGCDDKKTVTPDPSSDTFVYLLIDSIVPQEIPFQGGYFNIYMQAGFKKLGYSSIEARLTLKRYFGIPTDSCSAMDIPVTLSHREPKTLRFHTDQISQCNTGNYYARLKCLTLPVDKQQSEKYPFYWGHEVLALDTVKIGSYRMNFANTTDCNVAISCVKKSFNHPQLDSDYVRIRTEIPSPTEVRNEYFEGVTVFADLPPLLDTFVTNHHVGTDTFQIIYALNHDVGLYPGISVNKSVNSSVDNHWSYVFLEKIIDILQFGWDRQSANNVTSVHELIHQVGNIHSGGYPEEHWYHTGRFSSRCALWGPLNHFDTIGEIQDFTDFFRICNRHTNLMRVYLGNLYLGASLPENLSYSVKNSYSDNLKITMSLAKDSYKLYELVMAKFEIINLSEKVAVINGELFDPLTERNLITITDSSGNKWNTNKIPYSVFMAYPESLYVIQPHDTLFISMPINNWGEPIPAKSHRDWHFGSFGYFPANMKYSAFYNSDGLLSNSTEFEIKNLTDEDLILMEMFERENTVSNYENLIKSYPDNELIEYIYYKILLKKYWDIVKGKSVSSNLTKDYEDFFRNFPNTYYIYDDRFMTPYYMQRFYNKNFNNELRKLKNQNINDQLIRFLSSNNITQRIDKAIKTYKKKNIK